MTTWTNRGKLRLADGTFDADNLELAILTTTPSDATARDWNDDGDITSEMTTGQVSNYARQDMGTATIAEDDASDEVTIDYADTAFGSLVAPTPGTIDGTALCAIDKTSSEVMWVQALTAAAKTNGAAYTIVWPSDGAAYIDDV
ncbi:MAG: hypothetical protein GY926_06255 [bacterium]|uniref:hypothetical protein n=1 Tax=Herbaspirillum sp. TaxID=1890675 RepID=UPI002586F7DF|nr:hypothetical protein [Herbaspirillum sp.]MCP3949439.1 hypothetical protein [Herbaspirillum sp.]MCP4964820.1 hypothetical protein [bacterium]